MSLRTSALTQDADTEMAQELDTATNKALYDGHPCTSLIELVYRTLALAQNMTTVIFKKKP